MVRHIAVACDAADHVREPLNPRRIAAAALSVCFVEHPQIGRRLVCCDVVVNKTTRGFQCIPVQD